MKKILLSLLMIIGYNAYSQNALGKSDDAARITLAAYFSK